MSINEPSKSLREAYRKAVLDQIQTISQSQTGSISQAGKLLSETLLNNRWIFTFGTGHSHMLAEELFYRAGGLTNIRPILIPELMLHVSASESTEAERDLAWVDRIFGSYPMAKGDVLIIASNSGRNHVPVELAKRAQEQNLSVIVLINRQHANIYSSRHPSGNKTSDYADVVLDNGGIPGDAVLDIPTANIRCGATSTITGTLLLQLVICEAIEQAIAKGWKPALFQSSNAGGDEANEKLITKLTEAGIRHL